MKPDTSIMIELENKRQKICEDIEALDRMLSEAYPDKHTYLEVEVGYRTYRTLDSTRKTLCLNHVDINFKTEF